MRHCTQILDMHVFLKFHCLMLEYKIWRTLRQSWVKGNITVGRILIVNINSLFVTLQSQTKSQNPWDHSANITILSYWTLTKQTFSSPPSSLFNVVNNAEITFGTIPWHKLNIELRERELKNGNMIQHGVYHQNMYILYRGK